MPVWSHSKTDKDGNRYGSKLLDNHLNGVRDKAFQSKLQHLQFNDDENLDQILEDICWLHDLGKFTNYFQTYLLHPEKADYELKKHSSLGALAAFHRLINDAPKQALLEWYLIKMHHSNLRNIDLATGDPNIYNLYNEKDIFQKQVNALSGIEILDQSFPIRKEWLQFASNDDLYASWKKLFKRKTSIEDYFKINYLFSLLIESDKIDASESGIHERKKIPSNRVDERFGEPVYPEKQLKEMTQNELRNFVRHKVISSLNKEAIVNRKIFTLAAPTGIGKTMTALDFMLRLRSKIYEKEDYLPQFIYGLPFINIIEQALKEYEITIGEQAKILGHYQYADIFGSEDEDERSYNQKLIEWDTWQSDVVITSFVQFFETLIGNRNKLLKKFHHFAGSLIILDEVQTLALEKLPLIAAALTYLCKYLNARVLIMTATQPEIFNLMRRELGVNIEEESLKPFSLLPEANEVFACFNRTAIYPVVIEADNSEATMDIDSFLVIFKEKWNAEKSCLIVLNKVQRSINIFEALSELKKSVGFENPILYLSTNITPHERGLRVNWLKKNMKTGVKPILVSTQVVEAGVDLNFDIGFRDLGPIDSIVQVAGRINRENEESRIGSPLYVVNFGDCRKIYGSSTDTNSRHALAGESRIEEKDFKHLVEQYFKLVSDKTQADFKISREIFKAMEELRYDKPGKEKREPKTVSDFKIIENSHNGVSVYIESPDDPIATEARKAFQDLKEQELSKQEFDEKYKRNFNQRIIAVPAFIKSTVQLANLTDDILWVSPDEYKQFYNNETGFIRSEVDLPANISF